MSNLEVPEPPPQTWAPLGDDMLARSSSLTPQQPASFLTLIILRLLIFPFVIWVSLSLSFSKGFTLFLGRTQVSRHYWTLWSPTVRELL